MKTQAGIFTDKGDRYAERILKQVENMTLRTRPGRMPKSSLDQLKTLPPLEELEEIFRD